METIAFTTPEGIQVKGIKLNDNLVYAQNRIARVTDNNITIICDYIVIPTLDMALKKEENPEEFREILFNLADSNNPFSEANDVDSYYSYITGFGEGFNNILTYENTNP